MIRRPPRSPLFPYTPLFRSTSRKGKKMKIAAAYPRWPWSDLVDSLTPNGRFLDTGIAGPGQSREPLGVEIQSYVSGLFRSEEHTSELQSPCNLVCRLLLEKK